jgi:hypothetical protein
MSFLFGVARLAARFRNPQSQMARKSAKLAELQRRNAARKQLAALNAAIAAEKRKGRRK